MLEDMDKVIQQKRQELSELDARLETTRNELIEKESKELVEEATKEQQDEDHESILVAKDELLSKQKDSYEQRLAQQREEIGELEYINQELTRENECLNQELRKLADTNEKLKANTFVLSESVEELKSANFELNMQLARANSESKMQQKLLKKCHEQDQVLMDAFNDKLESLRKAIAKRDEEIDRLRNESRITLESLGLEGASLTLATVDDPKEPDRGGNLVDSNSKQRIIDIVAIVGEKNAQIEMLKQQLLQATKDIEKNAALLENLTKHSRLAEIRDELNAETVEDEDRVQLSNRCKMLEDELKFKDNHVHLVEFRNRNFEVVLPTKLMDMIQSLSSYSPEEKESVELLRSIAGSLREALTNIGSTQNLLDEIEALKREEHTRKRQIERLIKELNELDPESKLTQTIDITDTGPRTSTPKKAKKVHFENDFEESKQLDDVKDKSHLKTESDEPEKSEDKPEKPKEIENESKNGISSNKPDCPKKEPSKPTPSSSKLIRVRKYPTDSGAGVEHSPKYIALQKRVKELEDENELLELAMKEILLSIKWSDAKCGTILIDCPSLERLCQLIEARFLTLANSQTDLPRETDNSKSTETNDSMLNKGELFQMIVMKSELDLIRGQNEQLRSDMKMQKRDHQEMLAALTCDQVSRQQENRQGDLCEAGCQTELDELNGLNYQGASDSKEDDANKPDTVQSPERDRCKNCQRLVALANHLLECIVRIECKVSLSDETYMVRLITLYQFTQRLAKDLDMHENLLNESRRDYHAVVQQKLRAEAQLLAVEAQLNAHIIRCPILVNDKNQTNFQQIDRETHTMSNMGHHTRRSTPQGFSPDTVMTISLLQSIIGCLQARLEYKDERLRQLEQQYFPDTSAASTLDELSRSEELTSAKQVVECS